MLDTKRLIRPAVSVVIILATALGLYNVYSDNAEVVALAKQVACSDEPKCEATMSSQGRHAFAQTFTFRTNLPRQSSAEVSCVRSLYLLGAYRCSKK